MNEIYGRSWVWMEACIFQILSNDKKKSLQQYWEVSEWRKLPSEARESWSVSDLVTQQANRVPCVAKTQGESRVIRDKDLLLKTHHRDLSHKRVTRTHTNGLREKIGQREDATLLINYKAALPKYRLSILTHPNRSHSIIYLQVTCHVGSYLPGMWGTSCHILVPPHHVAPKALPRGSPACWGWYMWITWGPDLGRSTPGWRQRVMSFKNPATV